MRNVFFSFHYQRDIWRVNQIRNLDEICGCSAAGFIDNSLWEEAKKKGDADIKRMIDKGLEGTTVTVVFIGSQTANRKYVDYEIQQSIKRGNGIVGIQVHELKNQNGETDTAGATPAALTNGGYKVFKYADRDRLKARIEEAAKAAGR
jgi:hypothetical protein